MQAQRGRGSASRLVTDALVERGLSYEGARGFRDAAPPGAARRRHCPRASPIRARRGRARASARRRRRSQGFLKSAGLASLDEAQDREGSQEGRVLCRRDRAAGPRDARGARRDRAAAISRAFPGRNRCAGARPRSRPDPLRWVRPAAFDRRTFGPETEEPEIVAFRRSTASPPAISPTAIASWRPAPIKVRRFDDYVAGAREGQGRARCRRGARRSSCRRARPRLRAGARTGRGRGAARGGRRARRMAGRADGRVRGGFPGNPAGSDPRDDPRQPEMFRAADARAGALANKFILVANIEASDGGAAIVAGNGARRARPPVRCASTSGTDATCKNARLEEPPAPKAAISIVFHEKLGTQGERVERIAALARELAPHGRRRCRSRPSAPRASPRPISSPKWSASSPNCRA